LGGRKDSNSTKTAIWKRNAGVQSKHWHASQEFYLGEKRQGQTDVCVDRDRECKAEAAKLKD